MIPVVYLRTKSYEMFVDKLIPNWIINSEDIPSEIQWPYNREELIFNRKNWVFAFCAVPTGMAIMFVGACLISQAK